MVVELTHVASLYHDDVMDEARLRRGPASANARWGNTRRHPGRRLPVRPGLRSVAELGPDYVRLQARTFARLVQGQIAETVGPQDADPLEHYLPVVADKTGVPDRHLRPVRRQAGRRRAGRCSGRWRRTPRRSASSSSSATTSSTSPPTRPGKTPGTDLREGIPTLPTLLSPAVATDLTADARCFDCWTPTSATTPTWPRRWSCSGPPVRRPGPSRGPASRGPCPFLPDALPAGPAKDALAELCDSVVTRSV